MDDVLDDGWLHAIIHAEEAGAQHAEVEACVAGMHEPCKQQDDDAADQHAPHCPLNRDSPHELHRPRECQAQHSKKRRCNWTSDLHSAFEEAVRRAGARATPTTIWSAMDVSSLNLDFELTVGMVKSHLQKYKLECQCLSSSPLISAIYKQCTNAEPLGKRSPDGLAAHDGSSAVESRSQDEPQPGGEAGRSRGSALAPMAAPRPAGPAAQPAAILVTMLDAPRAMGLLVRTFAGYALSVHYELQTNTLVLTATPPAPPQAAADANVFGLTSLSLLREAQLSAGGNDELRMAFTRRCPLPHAPASLVVEHWPVQLLSTSAGDKTVCLQIEKASGRTGPASAVIIC